MEPRAACPVISGHSSGSSDPYDQEPAFTKPKAIMPPRPQLAAPAAAPAAHSSIALPNTDTQWAANANVSHSIALDIDQIPDDDCEEIM